ncbi:phospholipid phosphatase 5-like [Bolinopsis microptera]|uniref:phospholipid phosphatase 5-like n=1 Tax=Bolinopsis microptera TaxID=2820187 RepID=UPI003079074E
MGLRGNVVVEVALRVVLLGLYIWSDLQLPFTRVIQPEEWWLYKNPYTVSADVTVTTPQLFFIMLCIAALISLIGICCQNPKDILIGLLGFTMSILLNGFITNGIKLMVGRPRPDFYYRCFPDGISKFDGVTPICSGDSEVIIEGRKSFPSGHSSWSFAGLLFLSYYLAGKLQCFSAPAPKSLLNFCISLCPSLLALFIALSRYCDYWHHYQDIVWGSVLGTIIATVSYFYYYPSLSDPLSHKPRDSEHIGKQYMKNSVPLLPQSVKIM